MEFRIEEIEKAFNGEIINKISDNEYLIKIQDKEHNLEILNMDSNGMEFVLDAQFHSVKYIENETAEMKIVVDGTPLTIKMHSKLDKIVYKNSGGGDTGSAQINLRSQIPGKVVSVAVKVGDKIKKDDVVCVLESMKMQVSVKSHKDGEVKNLKIKEGNSVNKNDILAEIV
jgi:biotin carboxyl carrier protein